MAKDLLLKPWHAERAATFLRVNGDEFAAGYGDAEAEYRRLRESVGLLDLSGRGRLCLLGGDRTRFLNGQVTNDVKTLAPLAGCYAAICNAKGRMEADALIYRLGDEFLLDLEPGLLGAVMARFEKYVIADDVELADASEAYGCLSLQGPKAGEVLAASGLAAEAPADRFHVVRVNSEAGDLYVMYNPRAGEAGFDVFVPAPALEDVANRLLQAAAGAGGGLAGWEALEVARVEDGIPRFGADLDATTLPPEAGLEDRAISYTKGCYVGQEIIGRLRTRGQVARRLVGFRLAGQGSIPPVPGESVLLGGKPAGRLTSVVNSPRHGGVIALGYLRRGAEPGAAGLRVEAGGGWDAVACELPLQSLTEAG